MKHNGSQWISKTDVPSGNAPSADSTYWQLMLGTTDLKVLMTGDTASLDPNKVYVWEEAVTNLTITALNGGKEGRRNRYVFQFKNPKTAYTVLTLPSGVLWSSDTELDDNGVPVLDRDGCTRVEIVDNLATAKRWPSIYIIFEDPDVEAVLMSKGVSSDGIGITKRDMRAITSITRFFNGNTTIVSFNELEKTSVVELGLYSFADCANLKEVIIPSTCKTITGGAFTNCKKLESVGSLEGVTTLGNAAFRYCSALGIDVYMPNLASTNGNYPFMDSGVVSALSLGTITATQFQMFAGCKSLRYAILPTTLITLETATFAGCTSMEAIIMKPTTPPTVGNVNALNNSNNCPIYVPDSSVEAYKGAMIWSGFATRIKGISDLQTDNPELYAEIAEYL